MDDINFIVLGAGAWGTAMSIHLAKLNHKVVLAPRDENKAEKIRQANENIYHLEGIKLPSNLVVDTAFQTYLTPQTIVIIACPTQGLWDVCNRLASLKDSVSHIISLVKGLDRTSLKTPSELIGDILPDVKFSCLSGPTYAREFAESKPAAMVLASKSDVKALQKSLSNHIVRIYTSQDLRGVELGSCLKNIYAVGAGILDGLGLGDNAKAAYLTRALHEIAKLGARLGGKQETFYGLSGLGDLMATAQGLWSRNRNFGFDFAQGKSIESLLQNKTVEGYWSIQCFQQLSEKMSYEAPILNILYKTFYEKYNLSDAVRDLITRELKQEF